MLPPENTCINAVFSAWNLTNLNLHESVFPPWNICERQPFVRGFGVRDLPEAHLQNVVTMGIMKLF